MLVQTGLHIQAAQGIARLSTYALHLRSRSRSVSWSLNKFKKYFAFDR